MSTFTTNKNIEMPSAGMYVNAWAGPVNADWALIDTCLGGTSTVSVTGVSGPSIALSTTQYQPVNMEFVGTLSASLNYFIPAGVGGIWTINNATSGSFTLQFSIAAGNSLTLSPGRTFIVSDGTTVALASANFSISFPQIAGTVSNAQVPSGAVLQYQGSLSLAATQITSGTVANARLPNSGIGPGVTIAADPGTVPSGAAGAIFYYY
jgi:hypothetical protein